MTIPTTCQGCQRVGCSHKYCDNSSCPYRVERGQRDQIFKEHKAIEYRMQYSLDPGAAVSVLGAER